MVASGRATPTGSLSLPLAAAATANGTSVKVVLRIRPSTGQDHAANVPQRFQRTVIAPLNATTLQVDSHAAAVASQGASAGAARPASTSSGGGASGGGAGKNLFTFDRVVGPDEGQADVYPEAEPLVEAFLEGMNATILAYGQTSSGKSYTMGTDRTNADDDAAGDDRLGITPRAVRAIFDRIRDVERDTKGATTFNAKLSYVEIYNEDLIDLLAAEGDARPTVQIREDKQGNIIWSGLREVKVSSAADVMNNLTAGSALRQTNATDMNAQSSRSHAIFSLTLTQRKYTGTGTPAPPSPNPPAGSRLSRALPHVTSPTPGSRAATPTNERPGSRFGLRPPSALGRASSPVPPEEKDGTDSWVTITSKFHFVDLAGSERLKRTSAQGERVKEGISINSGLHALGNVISALGDPARARQTTHIPYRDSKLTRLLQDSLGGNAQTMMVACVSPTEFNLNETLSTLKYANRARNIKNRAEVNEVEVGWDDVEYLQRTITKLRVEMGQLKDGGTGVVGLGMGPIAEEGPASRRALGDAALQDRYSDLTQRYAQLTAALATAQAHAHATSSSSLSRDEFAKAVEPIVEEYEKSLSALEGQLSLTKAALGHSEDELRELEQRVEDDARAAEQREALIADLRVRVGKLGEREATTEAYVRDLELKLKDYADADESHGTAVGDLRKELARNREQAATTEQYVRELEQRLAKSSESVAGFRRQAEVLERDVARREEAYRDLESRLALLDTSGDHRQLLVELDQRDRRVLDLERSVDELTSQHQAAAAEAARLERVAAAEKDARDELQSRVRTLEHQSVASTKTRPGSLTPPQTPAEGATARGDPLAHEALDPAVVASLEARVRDLQRSYEQTLADLEAANLRYRNSRLEIDTLNAQVDDARAAHTDSDPPAPSPVSTTFGGGPDEPDSDTEVLADVPTTITPSTLQTSPSRTPRSRRSMPLAPQHRLSFLGRPGGTVPAKSHLRSASLSQELSSAQGLLFGSPPSPSGTRAVSPNPGHPSLRESMSRDSLSSLTGHSERSYEQMKSEVMKLQSALREREEEITLLEASLHASQHGGSSVAPSVASSPKISTAVSNGSSYSHTPRGGSPDGEVDVRLSPRTVAAFEKLKADLHDENAGERPIDAESSARLDEIMRSMAQKEEGHREVIEGLNDQLATLKRQHEELTVLSRDQVVNMSSEIGRLRSQLDGRPEAEHYEGRLKSMQDDLDAKHEQLGSSRDRAADDLSATSDRLAEEHQRALAAATSSHTAALLQLKEEHADTLRRHIAESESLLAQKDAEHAAALRSATTSHAEGLRLATLDHSAVLAARTFEADGALKRKSDELVELARRHELERTALVGESESSFGELVEKLNDEHADVLQKRESEFKAAIEKREADHANALSSRDASHAATRDEHDRALTEIVGSQSESLARVRDEHERSVNKLKDDHAAATGALTSQHDETIASLRAAHDSALASQAAAHASELAALAERHATEIDATAAALAEAHQASLEELAAKHEEMIKSSADAHADEIATLAAQHEEHVRELQQSHSAALTAASEAGADSKVQELESEHSNAVTALLEQHATALTALAASHEALRLHLEADHSRALAEQSSAHAVAIARLEKERDDARAAYLDLADRHEALGIDHTAAREAASRTKADHSSLLEQFAAATASHDAVLASHRKDVSDSSRELQASHDALSTLEKALEESQTERERLLDQVQHLDGAAKELEQYKLTVAKLETESVRTKTERDAFQAEVTRLAQTNGSRPSQQGPFVNGASPIFNGSPDAVSMSSFDAPARAMSPNGEGRTTPPQRIDSRLAVNGVAVNSKPPPPTPPPSMPPPPLPTSGTPSRTGRSSSTSSIATSVVPSSRDSTAATSIRPGSSNGTDSTTIDPRIAKKFEEQESSIARLTKQLTHCESDLQANIDLVNTLESALNDSERNLRKARTQMNDLARERDQFLGQNDALRQQIQEANAENENVRNSVLQVESRWQEERRGKEAAKAELERRLDDANKGRKSKYACF